MTPPHTRAATHKTEERHKAKPRNWWRVLHDVLVRARKILEPLVVLTMPLTTYYSWCRVDDGTSRPNGWWFVGADGECVVHLHCCLHCYWTGESVA